MTGGGEKCLMIKQLSSGISSRNVSDFFAFSEHLRVNKDTEAI